jgi:glycosyltransferase involved in cell wall biosynthesis
MRILQAFDFFSLPHGSGVMDVLYQLSRTLRQREHEVVIYTSDFELAQGYIDSLSGVAVYPFHSWVHVSGVHIMPGIIAEARKKLRDFDIVHLHACRSFQNIVIHHYARKYGVPYVIDAHGSTPRIAGAKLSIKRFLKWLYDVAFGYRTLRDAGKFIAETEVGVNEYKKLGVNPDKITLIHPPIDINAFSQLPLPGLFRRRYDIKERYVILFLGRIHWIKGIDFLVESFYQLLQQRRDVRLLIVGPDDGHKSVLDKVIDKLDLSDRILFTGFLDGEDKLSALVDADVLVQPSIYEQGARTPFEAIMCHTPVIVSRSTGSGEEVARIDAGYLVPYGHKSELVDRIQYVLDNPDEAQVKTQRAKKYIEANLSLASQTEKYEELYQEVAESYKK